MQAPRDTTSTPETPQLSRDFINYIVNKALSIDPTHIMTDADLESKLKFLASAHEAELTMTPAFGHDSGSLPQQSPSVPNADTYMTEPEGNEIISNTLPKIATVDQAENNREESDQEEEHQSNNLPDTYNVSTVKSFSNPMQKPPSTPKRPVFTDSTTGTPNTTSPLTPLKTKSTRLPNSKLVFEGVCLSSPRHSKPRPRPDSPIGEGPPISTLLGSPVPEIEGGSGLSPQNVKAIKRIVRTAASNAKLVNEVYHALIGTKEMSTSDHDQLNSSSESDIEDLKKTSPKTIRKAVARKTSPDHHEENRQELRQHFKTLTRKGRVPWTKLLNWLFKTKQRFINWPQDFPFPANVWSISHVGNNDLEKLLKVDIQYWPKTERKDPTLGTVLVSDQNGAPFLTVSDCPNAKHMLRKFRAENRNGESSDQEDTACSGSSYRSTGKDETDDPVSNNDVDDSENEAVSSRSTTGGDNSDSESDDGESSVDETRNSKLKKQSPSKEKAVVRSYKKRSRNDSPIGTRASPKKKARLETASPASKAKKTSKRH